MKIKKTIIIALILSIISTTINVNAVTQENEIKNIPNNLETTGEPIQKNWTLMFYDTESTGKYDPLEDVIKNAYSGENLNVIILQDLGAKILDNLSIIWYIENDHTKTPLKVDGEINMGNYTVLRDFIQFSKDNFPADRYILFMYGHGMAWKGACIDNTIGDTKNTQDTPYDYLTMNEIKQALAETGGVDCISFTNPCNMGVIESAYELRNHVDVFVGNQEKTMFIYWIDAFDEICDVLNEQSNISTDELGKKIVEFVKNNVDTLYRHYFSQNWLTLYQKIQYSLITMTFTLSAIKSNKLENLTNSIDILAENLIENIPKKFFKIWLIKKLTDSFPHRQTDVKPFLLPERFRRNFQTIFNNGFGPVYALPTIDIYNFAEYCKLYFNSSNQTIYKNANNVTVDLENAVIANSCNYYHRKSHGLSIFFPNMGIGDRINYDDYLNVGLDFVNDTHWDELIGAYLNPFKQS